MRKRAGLAAGVVMGIVLAASSQAAERDAATCPVSLGKGQQFRSLELMLGSPDGRLGKIAQNGSAFDASGKHGRDLYPLAGEADVFMRCSYEGGRAIVTKLPPGVGQCEVRYTYIGAYDTRADRVFCR